MKVKRFKVSLLIIHSRSSVASHPHLLAQGWMSLWLCTCTFMEVAEDFQKNFWVLIKAKSVPGTIRLEMAEILTSRHSLYFHDILISWDFGTGVGWFLAFSLRFLDEGRQSEQDEGEFFLLCNHKIIHPSKFPHEWVLILLNAWFASEGFTWRWCHQSPYGRLRSHRWKFSSDSQ